METIPMANNVQVNVSDENVLVIRVDEHLEHVTIADVGLRGAPGLVFRGDYSATADYFKGDVVTFEGSAYVAHAYSEASTVEPDQSPHFSTLVEKGEEGATGILGAGTIDGGTY